MFQRLKASIDSRIAEEQARQKAAAQEASSSPSQRPDSAPRRSSSRKTSPSKRQGRPRFRDQGEKDAAGRGPDPSEFEPEFVIGEDDVESRAGTPGPKEKSTQAEPDGGNREVPTAEEGGEVNEKQTEIKSAQSSPELPTEIRVKLRKLDKLESRYQELLRSYRIAHARVLSIEPFETALRETTPLTSISDPGALIEYLNQINLKGDMVMDELKRVTTEKDSFKQKFVEAEKSTREALDEIARLKTERDESAAKTVDSGKAGDASTSTNVDSQIKEPELDITATPAPLSTPTVRSPVTSILSKALFSPAQKPKDQADIKEESEEVFSYDSEIPRLESELQEREANLMELKTQVRVLNDNLTIAKESTESMARSLEAATRELQSLKDTNQQSEKEFEEQRKAMGSSLEDLKERLKFAQQELETVVSQQAARHGHDEESEKLQGRIGGLEREIWELRTAASESDKRVQTLNGIVKHLRDQAKDAETAKKSLEAQVEEKANVVKSLETTLSKFKDQLEPSNQMNVDTLSSSMIELNGHDNTPLGAVMPDTTNTVASQKKKNKKKKKGGKGTAATSEAADEVPTGTTEGVEKANGGDVSVDISKKPADISDVPGEDFLALQEKLAALYAKLLDKESYVESLQTKLKGKEELKEEVESLRDDLINLGQEYVEVKDRIMEAEAEKVALCDNIQSLQNTIAELRINQVSKAETDEAMKSLELEVQNLKATATALQTDLSAAQQLAASRFKDLTELREVLQKAQPELLSLRREVADLNVSKAELSGRVTELKKLGDAERHLREEVNDLKKQIHAQDLQVNQLKEKVKTESSNKTKAEDQARVAQKDLRIVEGEKVEAIDRAERLSKDLAKAQEDLGVARSKIRILEGEVAKLERQAEGLQDEIHLKIAQHTSAQSLIGSMRDQTAEMGMQMKEARERCESMEEELADAHRLLSERSREGETMRRLLADVEGRADSKVREMRERMELAIEERDRAEDEAGTIGRKRSREIDELKNKVREAESNLKRIQDEKEDWEKAENGWRRTHDEFKERADQSAERVKEVEQAMGELRDALDESERQVRDLEKQRSDLRKTTEDLQDRLEKLQKSNKSMAEELRSVQAPKIRGFSSEVQSSRSSIDSSPSRSGLSTKGKEVTSPIWVPPTGPGASSMDYVYLKNVLLQFLEQKDKKLQIMLIPVLAQLLHFDRKDEQKWMAAVTAK